MDAIDKDNFKKLLIGKRIVSIDTDWPKLNDECGEVKITTDDGVAVVFTVGQNMGEAFIWFSRE